MKYINYFNGFLSKALGINGPYVNLIMYTVITIIGTKIVCKLLTSVYFKMVKNNKSRFNFVKKVSLLSNLFIFVVILMIWEEFIVTFITLISFVSAAIAYSLRDTIINFFCGIYIKLAKPFVIEDRIMIDGYIGDVVNITSLSFEILEVNPNTFQSTGVTVHIPNSKIFAGSLKNYVVFAYKDDFYHLTCIIDHVLYDKKDNIFDLIVINLYKLK